MHLAELLFSFACLCPERYTESSLFLNSKAEAEEVDEQNARDLEVNECLQVFQCTQQAVLQMFRAWQQSLQNGSGATVSNAPLAAE